MAGKSMKYRIPRPVRMALGGIALVLIVYVLFSWIQGYGEQIRYAKQNAAGEVVLDRSPSEPEIAANCQRTETSFCVARDDTGRAIVVGVDYRPGPVESLANLPELFPTFLRQALPLVLYITFFFFIIVFQFMGMFWFLSRGQSYTIHPGEYDVTYDDVRGQPAIVDATKEVVKLFEGFKEFRKMGGYPPHGILFEGPPGTGKTLLGKAIAGSTNVPFLYTNGTSLNSMFFGVGNMRIASMFRKARRLSKEYDGAVIFIDELDAVAGSRGQVSNTRTALEDPVVPPEHREFWSNVMKFVVAGGMGGANSMLVNELLVQMDGLVLPKRRFRSLRRAFKMKPKVPVYNILIIGATNRATVLDPALLRPGRFDRKIHVGNPSAEGRKDIIQYYLDKVKHDPNIDVDKLANTTVGYSPARIKNIINEGLIFALQDGRDAVTYDDIWQAKLTDEIGLKQPVTYSPWEKESTAIHEAGHAVAAWFLKPSETVEVVTIQKRESAMGLVHTMDLEERFSRTRDELLADIKVMLAGMAAEQLWYDQTTSGPSSDLRNATIVAAQMVAYFGMGESLVSAAAIPPSAWGPDVMATILADIETRTEVESILRRCRDEVAGLLERKPHCIEALRDRLLVDEQLTGEQFAALMDSLDERRQPEVMALRRPPRVLGALPMGTPLTGNGSATGGNAETDGDSGAPGEHLGPGERLGPPPAPPSPWARPPGDDRT